MGLNLRTLGRGPTGLQQQARRSRRGRRRSCRRGTARLGHGRPRPRLCRVRSWWRAAECGAAAAMHRTRGLPRRPGLSVARFVEIETAHHRGRRGGRRWGESAANEAVDPRIVSQGVCSALFRRLQCDPRCRPRGPQGHGDMGREGRWGAGSRPVAGGKRGAAVPAGGRRRERIARWVGAAAVGRARAGGVGSGDGVGL
eukprot:scaffold14246_cov105-Isochrysis_galbana.AAC.6